MIGLRNFFFSLILLFGFWAFAQDPESFLSEQKMIRVYVDSAPGFGHQSAGISVMRRLRELGFDGLFEVIYQQSVSDKIQKIYPSFPEGIEGQLKYLSVESYEQTIKENTASQVKLAISGADDGFGSRFYEISLAETYLRLQPLGWGQSAVFGADPKLLKQLENLPLANVKSPDWGHIRSLMVADKTMSQDKKEFVIKFAEVSGKHFHFPVYGVGTQVFAPQRLYFYGKAVKAAAKKIHAEQSIIVPVLSPFNAQEMDTMAKVFGKAEGFESSIPSELKHQKQMHILTPHQFNELTSLKPGNVYFVFVGSVPQAIYNFFYEQANLPVWVAGKNAMSFALTKGKPYFNTVNDYYLPEKANLSAASIKVLEKAQTAFSQGYDHFSNQSSLTAVSRFIQEVSSPGTELESFFRQIGAKMSATDKVFEGLREVTKNLPGKSCSTIFN